MSHSIPRRGVAQTPAAAVTLAQTEILAPVVMAIAAVLLAAVRQVSRLLNRG